MDESVSNLLVLVNDEGGPGREAAVPLHAAHLGQAQVPVRQYVEVDLHVECQECWCWIFFIRSITFALTTSVKNVAP